MVSLRELQTAFLDAALHGDSVKAAAMIVENGIPAERRLNIYANNARENFLATLEAAFPVLVKLAGRDWFRQTGRDYMRQHPSRAGNLHFVGERLADFLDVALRGSDYRYFADVARLEWAYQEVLVAADHPPFDVRALATVPPEDYERLSFDLHPAVRLIESSFPILQIWKANQDASGGADTIDLSAGASRVLLVRRDDHVELRELPAIDFRLLEAFSLGKTFAQAAEDALSVDATGDLGAALARLVQLETLVDFFVHS